MTWIDHETVWEDMMSPDHEPLIAYSYVEKRAKDFLEQHRGAKFTTVQLVEHLYSGDNNQTDQRIFAALKALMAYGLLGYWEACDGRKIWTAPEAKTCPNCGGKI